MKNDRRIVMMNDSRYDRNGGRSGGAASGGAMPPHGKVRRLPLRERDVYRAAIRAHLAPKERVREAALAAATGGARDGPGRPAAQAAAARGAHRRGAAAVHRRWVCRGGVARPRGLYPGPLPDGRAGAAGGAHPRCGERHRRRQPGRQRGHTASACCRSWRTRRNTPAGGRRRASPRLRRRRGGGCGDIVPAAGEVLYDGERLQWTTVLTTDYAAMFEGGTVVDALADRCYYTVEGSGERHELSCGGGVHKIEGNDLLLETSARTDAAFPDSGTVTVTQTIRILDCKVDMQGDCATLALLTHSFTFDAAGGAAVSDTARLTIPLSGTYCLTLDEVDADGTEWLQNELVSLDGVALDAAVEYRQTGVYVTLTLAQNARFLDGGPHRGAAERLLQGLLQRHVGGLHHGRRDARAGIAQRGAGGDALHPARVPRRTTGRRSR